MAARFQIDWQRIKDRLGTSQIEVPFLFQIPDAGRHLLLAQAQRLKWDSTYIGGMDDQLEKIADDTITALMGDESMSDIADAIRYLVDNWQPPVVTQTNNNNQDTNVTSQGGDCGCTPVNTVNPDGSPTTVVYAPIPVDDPFSTSVPEWNDGTETAPDGWPSFEDFSDKKCLAANFMFDLFVNGVEVLDLAENIGSGVTDIIAVFLEHLPKGLRNTTTYLKALKILEKLTDYLTDFEDLADWAQLIAAVMNEYKREIVCAIYSAPDAVTAAASVATLTLPAIASAFTLQVTTGDPSAIVALTQQLISEFIPQAFEYQVASTVPDDYVPTIDCATCGLEPPSGFTYIPAEVSAVYPAAGSGVSGLIPTFSQTSAALEFTATAAGRTARLDVELVEPPELTAGQSYVGLRFVPHELIQINPGKFGVSPGTVSAEDIWSFVQANFDSDVAVNVTREDAGFPTSIDGERVAQSNSVNISAGRDRAAVTCESGGVGTCKASWGGFFWILKDS